MVWLSHSYGKRVLAVLAIVHIAKIHFIFPGKEELVGWREKANGPAPGFDDAQTVARTQPYRVSIQSAAKIVLLPRSRWVAPNQASAFPDREALQPGQVFVCHRRLLRLGNRFLPEQTRSLVNREVQPSRENAHLKSWEGDLQTGSLSPD